VARIIWSLMPPQIVPQQIIVTRKLSLWYPFEKSSAPGVPEISNAAATEPSTPMKTMGGRTTLNHASSLFICLVSSKWNGYITLLHNVSCPHFAPLRYLYLAIHRSLSVVEVQVRVHLWSTEEKESVIASVTSIFPGMILKGDREMTGTTQDLSGLKGRIRDQMIRATARKHLKGCVEGNRIRFYLNKQAALYGRVNFSYGEGPLGDIAVTIVSPEPETTILDLTGTAEKTTEECSC